MAFDLASWVIFPAAYFAAGIYYVLRELKLGSIEAWHVRGLIVVGLLWLPITLLNVVTLRRTEGLKAAAERFTIETMPPLLLGIAILAAAYA